jgi:hypothetical protein
MIDSWPDGAAGPVVFGPGPVATTVLQSQMLTTLSPCTPGCPMSFAQLLIPTRHERGVFENASLALHLPTNPQENH